jgi:hypothetical protein
MNICPNCHHQELSGALFCSECGAQLVFTDGLSTQTIPRSEEEGSNTAERPVPVPVEAVSAPASDDTVISLHLVDIGKLLPLAGRTEFTLGRVTEGQPILPDIDLTPYEAYSRGVSRLHSALKIVNKRVVIVDLGSSNGTRVNGQKIVPNVDYPLNNGDVIALGRLRIQVLFKR